MEDTQRLRIVVLGYVVRGALGGHAWHHLNYVAGLAALGHDVWFAEDSDNYASCYNPVLDTTTADPTYGLEFARDAFNHIGLAERWMYHDAHTGTWYGPAAARRNEIARTADVVINISGVNPLGVWQSVPVRAYIDTDPGFTQVKHLTKPEAGARAAAHTVFFTFAESVGSGARLPDDGIAWKPTRQPLAMHLWPVQPPRPEGRFTTVMVWESYAAVVANGVKLGLKAQSFGPFFDLPQLTTAPLEMALGGPSAPRDQLQQLGWHLIDPRIPSRTLRSYQQYLSSSRAEFSVAKHGYVETASGWFSERSANYLASGRPVITQDTGFSARFPTGEGLFPFTAVEDALDAFDRVQADYFHHCKAARGVAEDWFDARQVLPSMLETAMG